MQIKSRYSISEILLVDVLIDEFRGTPLGQASEGFLN